MRLQSYFFLLLLITTNISTIFFIKKMVMKLENNISFQTIYAIFALAEFYLVLLFGTASMLLFFYLTAKEDLSNLMPTLTGLITLLVSIIGILVFKESASLNKVVGLFVIFSGILIISNS